MVGRSRESRNATKVAFSKDFTLFFLAQSVSFVGTGMAPVAVAFAVLKIQSTSLLGVVLAARAIPQVIALIIGGILADRLGRKPLMIAANLLAAISQGGLGIIVIYGHAQPWHFVLLSSISGLAGALFLPAASGVVPALVPKQHFQKANGVLSLGINASRLLGTALAGVIVASISAGWAILIDGISFALAALLTAFLCRLPSKGAEKSMLTELRVGWREFVSRRWIWHVGILSSASSAVFFACFNVIGPSVANKSLYGARGWSAILTATMVGLLVGAAAGSVLRLKVATTLAVSSVCVGTPILLLALDANLALMLIAGLGTGIAISVFDVIWNTQLQNHVSDTALSRVNAWDFVAFTGFGALCYAGIGQLERQIGTKPTLLLGYGIIAVIASSFLKAGVPDYYERVAPDTDQTKFAPGPNANRADT
jgi:MFS family permease